MTDESALDAVRLRCPVRGCGRALERHGRSFGCEAGHAFDIARSGYVNLLLAGDRRSRSPGDSRDAVAARRRYLETGSEGTVVAAVGDVLREHAAQRVLDVGCGEGFYLRTLGVAGAGVDISTAAIDAAARADRGHAWIVANADRELPLADAQFDAVLSITSRRNAAEFSRLLAPGGVAVVVVPGADDLVELREAVLGRGDRRERVDSVAVEMAPRFTLASRRTIRDEAQLVPDALRDLLASTYRGARTREHSRASGLSAMTVTIHRDLCVFSVADERGSS